MATFVLVHGAFHGAWCWVKLKPALEARGHEVVTLDLPSQGEDTTPISESSLAATARRVAEVVMLQPEPVILVGHSMGGMAIAAAAERLPTSIALLVFLCAFLPKDGDSVVSLSASPAARREPGPKAFRRSEDGLGFFPIPEMAGDKFYNGCSDEDVRFAIPRLRPQSFAAQRAAVHLTEQRYGNIPRVYIECVDDNVIPLGLQREMAARSPCRSVIPMPSGHSPFFAMPQRLAEVLDQIAKGGVVG
jgi:pimeloyl-ACP methyl ester carboxylesterase